MIDEIAAARDAALAEIDAADSLESVTALDSRLLGKKGALAQLKTQLGALATVDEKRTAGQAVNEAMEEVAAGNCHARHAARQRRRPLPASQPSGST